MADQEMLAAIGTGELIMQVNAERSFYDPFRLNTSLDQIITQRTGAAKVGNSAALLAAGDQAGAQDRVVQGGGSWRSCCAMALPTSKGCRRWMCRWRM